MFRIVRRPLDRADRQGIDRRAVIGSLRPDTQRIWMALMMFFVLKAVR
jgi:uncharacterized NAD(P)/FAD-binding protein YdhS